MSAQSEWRPAIDVIVPTIGRPSLLRAIRSVRDQTLPARAIIVLDDRSARQRVENMLADAGNFRLIETAGNVGGAAARNAGLESGDGEIVAFLDDDDWWEPTSLERRVGVAADSFRAGSPTFVGGAFWHRRDDSARVVPTESPPLDDLAALANYLVVRKDLFFGRTALQSSTMVMTGALARDVRWNQELPKHQDWDFALRAISLPRVSTAWLPEPTVHVQKDSVASVSRRLRWRDSLTFLNLHPELGGRARSDFLAVHVLRAALATRSLDGVRAYFAENRAVPHAAALAIALSGVRPVN